MTETELYLAAFVLVIQIAGIGLCLVRLGMHIGQSRHLGTTIMAIIVVLLTITIGYTGYTILLNPDFAQMVQAVHHTKPLGASQPQATGAQTNP